MFRTKTALRTLRPIHRQCAIKPHTIRFNSSKPRPDDLPPSHTGLSLQESFAYGPIFVLNVAKRFIKFSAIGIVALGITSAVLFEGSHMWVENVVFALPQDDEETRNWEWNLERENWSGDIQAAGTDSGLGFRGRHLVRAAWMAQHWTLVQDDTVLATSSDSQKSDDSLLGSRGLVLIDPRLIKSEIFLRDAISIAEQKSIQGKLRPWSMTSLLTLHASVLERMGPESMVTAKSQYERAWSSQPSITPQSARIALKIGDLNRRLGNDDEALKWWNRAIHVAHPSPGNHIPTTLPSSPYAQRSLLFILSSLSAFHASSGNLTDAKTIAETSLDLIRSSSIRQSESIASISPPHVLHALTILQRSSVLAIHLAEVLYAQKKPTVTSIQWLSQAAESSERVLRALDKQTSSIQSVYLESPSLNKPATSLYRDARRTAAEAWNLTGILLEKKDPKKALAAYENAVRLAGSNEEQGKPADRTLKADWDMIWDNYMRLKSKS